MFEIIDEKFVVMLAVIVMRPARCRVRRRKLGERNHMVSGRG